MQYVIRQWLFSTSYSKGGGIRGSSEILEPIYQTTKGYFQEYLYQGWFIVGEEIFLVPFQIFSASAERWKNQLFAYPLAWSSPHYKVLQWTMRIRLWFLVTIFLRVSFLYLAMQILAVLEGVQNTLPCSMEACAILTWLNCEYDFRRCMTAAPLAFQSFVQLCFFTPSSLSCFLHIRSFFRRDELSKERNITEGNELKV